MRESMDVWGRVRRKGYIVSLFCPFYLEYPCP